MYSGPRELTGSMVGFNLLLPLFVASSERANEPHAKKMNEHKLYLRQLVFTTFLFCVLFLVNLYLSLV